MQGPGAAYVFRFDGMQWVEEQRLESSDATGLQQFGNAVAVEGWWLLVGADTDDLLGTSVGTVYAFQHDGNQWVETQRLDASGANDGRVLGTDVTLDGIWAVLSAPRDNTGATGAGRAYLFQRNGSVWSEVRIFEASEPASQAKLGWSVALEDDVVVLGAPGDDRPVAEAAGSARVYHLNAGGLALDASPNSPAAGGSMSFNTYCGPPGQPAFLYTVSIDGTPLFLRVAKGSFDANGQDTLGAVVPPGLSGLVVVFQSFTLNGAGSLVTSNLETVSFQ